MVYFRLIASHFTLFTPSHLFYWLNDTCSFYYRKEKMSGFMIFQSHTPTFIVVPFNFIQPFASLSSLSRSAWDFLR